MSGVDAPRRLCNVDRATMKIAGHLAARWIDWLSRYLMLILWFL